MNGTILCAISLGRALVEPRQAVVGEDLPRGDRADERVSLGLAVVVETEGAEPDARGLRLGPTASEEVRPTDGAEALRRSAIRRVRREELRAFEHADRVGLHAAAHRAVPAGDALAERAVAMRCADERLRHLELHSSAEAAALNRLHR